MSTKRWEKGDLVQLKSGGPPMLVEEVHELGGAVMVKWHAESTLTFASFASEALVPFVAPPAAIHAPQAGPRGRG